jgi:hypothetical protein
MKYFEDVRVGESRCSLEHHQRGGRSWRSPQVSPPSRVHTDPEAAKTSFFGGLIASGWHTCAIMMRISVEAISASKAAVPGRRHRLLPLAQAGAPGDTLT